MRSSRLSFVVIFCLASLGATAASPTETSPTPAYELALPMYDDGLPGKGSLRRHTWFQRLWHGRRTDWARQVEADQGALVFFGDSITQGWEKTMAADFAGVKIANRGISGDTTRGLLMRLELDVLALNPSGVVLLIGTNDIEEVMRNDAITNNVVELVERIKAHDADTPIILCQVFPSSPKKARGPEYITDLNARYRAAFRGDPQVIILDTWTLFANAEGNAVLEEMPDLLHPNAIGYAKWRAALWPILATLGFVDTDVDLGWQPEPGYTSLFNGQDLTGWGYRPTSAADRQSATGWMASDPNVVWPFVDEPVDFDGLTQSPDGRFAAINGRLVVTTPAEGRKIQQLWTTREIGTDFELRMEFRSTPNADSGVYVRGPQLQCRDYALAGPWKDLPHYQPQAWNELVITVRGSELHATCNGDELDADLTLPASGPIGLEGDRGQMEYRRIRYKAL
ncbi:GDSL-type esterase/lipase family protein [Synoicihabitans lomoniglobus]|uniref:GDSL-type esterase/lipase family protein n=1 Tax=Synoicihabitans lomoniglobus TaxID=2909285 RepID=A0AAF0CN11_9BACT|nr:GDSL-type esterase/lipase family protein [Opitutaceae bacterium LMO-M01]WED64026.1 GDSL-type esterase/lipase family protein [Opitutaceae bacterium LMO-M01]